MSKSILISVAVIVAACCQMAIATPSTTYWTPCTLDFQAPKVTHLTYDTYQRAGKPSEDNVPQFATDLGLTWGSTFGKGLAAEYGFDYLAPADDPLFFNAKFGYPEKTLSANAPAVELGFFNFGTKSKVTTQNIVYGLVGKSLPKTCGRLSVAYYVGSKDVLVSSAGKKENTGFMVGYDKVLVPDKWTFAADYASGKNMVGGGGFGIYRFFAKNAADVLFGPVWFNDKGLNGKMKWTMQLDVNF